MKKTITKVGLMIMALTTMITMNACSKINNETSNDVCAALYKKYGESFVADKIGDRFNTDSAKLYVHPETNEDLIFIARINSDTGSVEDNYVEEKVNFQVENMVKKAFSEKGISVSVRCMVVTQEPLEVKNAEYTPAGFQEKYLFDHYTLYLAIEDGEVLPDDIIDALITANKTVGAKLAVAGYVFESENYSTCANKIKEVPDVSITMIEAENPILSFNINITNGECSISETELAEKWRRS